MHKKLVQREFISINAYVSLIGDTNKYLFFFSATTSNLSGMLVGRFIVGIGLGIGPPVASLYITEVKWHYLFAYGFGGLGNGSKQVILSQSKKAGLNHNTFVQFFFCKRSVCQI